MKTYEYRIALSFTREGTFQAATEEEAEEKYEAINQNAQEAVNAMPWDEDGYGEIDELEEVSAQASQ